MRRHQAPDEYEYEEDASSERWSRGRSGGARRWLRVALLLFVIPLLIGAGVAFFAGRTYVDIGYRFRRAFQMRDALEFSQVGVMLGVNF